MEYKRSLIVISAPFKLRSEYANHDSKYMAVSDPAVTGHVIRYM